MQRKSQDYYAITSLLEQKRFDEAVARIESGPSQLSEQEKLECWGNYYFYKKDQQKAINEYEKAIKLDSNYYVSRYHYILAVKAELKNNFQEAFDRYTTAIDVEPTFVDPYIDLGAMLFKVNDAKGAAKCFERALEFDPYDLRIFYNLKEVYAVLAKEDPEEYEEKKKRIDEHYTRLSKELGPLPDNHHRW